MRKIYDPMEYQPNMQQIDSDIFDHVIAARTTEPITDAVKYSLDCFVWPASFPRIALNSTDPPNPIKRPRL